MVMEDLLWVVTHNAIYDGVSQNCILKTYIILLDNLTPLRLILKNVS